MLKTAQDFKSCFFPKKNVFGQDKRPGWIVCRFKFNIFYSNKKIHNLENVSEFYYIKPSNIFIEPTDKFDVLLTNWSIHYYSQL